jgi:hypothetical protein
LVRGDVVSRPEPKAGLVMRGRKGSTKPYNRCRFL